MPKFTLGLITGASSGLGEALAIFLAEKKIPLLLTGRNEVKLKALQASLQHQVPIKYYKADLGNRGEREAMIVWAVSHSPDLIINNAGAGFYGEAVAKPSSEQLELIELDVSAPVEIALETAKRLKSLNRPGVILNVSSAAAFFTFPYFSSYAASKSFLNQWSKGMDIEMKPYGIRVLAACPGQIATSFYKNAGGKQALRPSWLLMEPRLVAKEIWQQIEKQKTINVIDWRYRLAYYLSKFLPDRLLAPILGMFIKKRL